MNTREPHRNPQTPHPESPPWTDQDLERFTDGAMNEAEADALRAALLADPEIRAGLAELQRTDALAATVFDGLMSGDDHATSRAMNEIARRAIRRAAHRALAIAAALLLLISGAFLVGRLTAPATPSPAFHAPIAHAPVTHDPSAPPAPLTTHALLPSPAPDSPHSAVRTVLEIRLPPRDPAPPSLALASDGGAPASTHEDPSTAPALSAPSSTPTAAPSLASRGREREILALGRALRSAELARATLDAMPGEDQLEACRIWARDPSLRPVAFERLARLQNDPAYAAECARIAHAMSEDKHLLAWARSHNLRTTTSTHQ